MEIVMLDHGNAELLTRVAEDVFDYEINRMSLSAFLDCPRHSMALAVDDGLVVGMASAVDYFHPDKSPQLWINEVGVTATRRNEGIGKRLVKALLSEAKIRGCGHAWLGTMQDNVAARRCFQGIPGCSAPQNFVLYEWQLGDHDTI